MENFERVGLNFNLHTDKHINQSKKYAAVRTLNSVLKGIQSQSQKIDPRFKITYKLVYALP